MKMKKCFVGVKLQMHLYVYAAEYVMNSWRGLKRGALSARDDARRSQWPALRAVPALGPLH